MDLHHHICQIFLFLINLFVLHVLLTNFHSPFLEFLLLGDRAFSVAAPTLWNSLPLDIRCCVSLQSFKTLLKTHLYNKVCNRYCYANFNHVFLIVLFFVFLSIGIEFSRLMAHYKCILLYLYFNNRTCQCIH